MNTLDFAFDIKSMTDEGHFSGLLSVYGVVDEGKDIVERGAFTKTISEHGGKVPMLWQHDPRQPIGMLSMRDTETALEVEGRLTMGVAKAREAYALMKDGVVRGLSIGYRAVKDEMDGAFRRLKEIRLYEGSVVTFPMNTLATITTVKADEGLLARIESLETELKALRASTPPEPEPEPPKESTDPEGIQSLLLDVKNALKGERQ